MTILKTMVHKQKEDQFRRVVEEKKDMIFRLCCCYVRRECERSDVYQEILINIWKGLESFERRSQLGTWVYRVAVNTCLAHVRGEGRRNRVLTESTGDEVEGLSTAPDPAGAAERMDTASRLYACINDLPVLDRTLVSLYLEDMSTKEMAGILGISEANVRVKLHRVKQNLKANWERRYHGSE